VAGWCGQSKSYLAGNRDQWQDGVERAKVIWMKIGTRVRMVWTRQKLSGRELRTVAGWCGQGESYLVQNRDQWQDGVDRVKVIWFRTGTSGRMVWTGQKLSG